VRVSAEGGRASVVKRHARAQARRYARALLAVASAAGPEQPMQLRAELDAFARLFETSRDLVARLMHPGLGAASRRRLLAAVAERAGASAPLRRLLVLLAERDRLRLLPALADAYRDELNASRGVVSADAASAVPLADAQREALAAALGAIVGKHVELTSRHEPALVGGVLVRLAGRSYDGSLRSQLVALRRRLAAGG
jgi:F-type H+-transporting ATPase subunit delta